MAEVTKIGKNVIKSTKSSSLSNEMYRFAYQNDRKKILHKFGQFLKIPQTCSMAEVKQIGKKVIKSTKSSPISIEMYRLGYQNDHK
jgi:hypothetical protein